MPLILFGLFLLALKYFEIGFFANISWWWIVTPFFIAFIWFEVVEPNLGLDKKRGFDELEEKRKERVRKVFDFKRKNRK